MCAIYFVPMYDAAFSRIIDDIVSEREAGRSQIAFDFEALPGAEKARELMLRPTDSAPVLTSDGCERMRFGFSVGYASAPQFNARSESAAVKPMFARHFRERRCLVPAAFYSEKGHQFCLPDGQMMYFAALFRVSEDGWKEYVILTRDSAASQAVAPIHDRMPVILPDEYHALWLEKGYGLEAAIVDVVIKE